MNCLGQHTECKNIEIYILEGHTPKSCEQLPLERGGEKGMK